MLKAIKKAIESFKYWVNYYPPELKEMHKNALEANKAYEQALDKVKKAPVKRKPAVKTTRSKTMATKPGLYANIHAKQERIEKQKASGGKVETMRKAGAKGAPTAKDFKDAAKTAKVKK